MISEGRVGVAQSADGSTQTVRLDKTNAIVVADAHARFQEAVLRGNVFSGGMTTTSVSNVTFTTGTTGATATPIIGLWNPSTSTKNAVILQVKVQGVVTATTATGGGAFVWMTATGQTAISTGITPLNRLTLASTGSSMKVFANTAVTGLSGSLTVQEASGIQPGMFINASVTPANVGGGVAIDNIDGSIIVPPGGLIGLFCTTTPVALSAASSILWEEIPV